MSTRRLFRAGDVVRQVADGEEWLLACDEENGHVLPLGWPCSREPVDSIELVKAASDDDRMRWLRELAARTDNDPRTLAAKRQLAAALPLPPNPEHETAVDALVARRTREREPEPLGETVTQAEWRRDPPGVYQRAKQCGRVTILDDETGEPVAVLGIPRDKRPTEDDLLERIAELEAAAALAEARDAVQADLLHSARRAAEFWREEWAKMSDDDPDDPDPRPPLAWEGGESLDARLTAVADRTLALTAKAPTWAAEWPTEPGWYWTRRSGRRDEPWHSYGYPDLEGVDRRGLLWGERIPEPEPPREDESR